MYLKGYHCTVPFVNCIKSDRRVNEFISMIQKIFFIQLIDNPQSNFAYFCPCSNLVHSFQCKVAYVTELIFIPASMCLLAIYQWWKQQVCVKRSYTTNTQWDSELQCVVSNSRTSQIYHQIVKNVSMMSSKCVAIIVWSKDKCFSVKKKPEVLFRKLHLNINCTYIIMAYAVHSDLVYKTRRLKS